MKLTLLLTILAVLAGVSTKAADEKITREQRRIQAERRAEKLDIDKHIHQINALDNKPSALKAGMAEVSKQTAVPLPTIEQQHKEHPKVGLAGLFLANELATHTHKPVMHFIRQREDGKTWNELATANGENLETIDSKLIQIETAMKHAK
jgi:hypothetical protein